MPLPMYPSSAAQSASKQSSVRHIVAVASGKGGVGKSTVTAGLAVALSRRGLRIGILDADVYGPSMATMLPAHEEPRLDGERLEPAISSGIRLLSMAHFRPEWRAMGLRAPMANGIIDHFLRRVDWGDLDLLLVDFPPGTGDVQLTLCQHAALSGAILVTTPQKVALGDVRRAYQLFLQMHVPVLGVVENMSYLLSSSGEQLYPFGRGGGDRFSKECGLPFLGEVPLDPTLCLQCDEGEVASWRGATEGAPAAFYSIADTVLERVSTASGTIPVLQQKDRYTLVVKWPDGFRGEYRLSELQRRCPCAQCSEKLISIDGDVGATAVHRVGRYAVRLDFQSGCSSGIYPFSMLRELAS